MNLLEMGSYRVVPSFIQKLRKIYGVPGGFNAHRITRHQISFASDNLGDVGGPSRREGSSRAHYLIATRARVLPLATCADSRLGPRPRGWLDFVP